MSEVLEVKDDSKFEVTPEVEKELISMAQRHAHRVNDEIGLLYHKLRHWYKKYGEYPTAGSMNRITKFLHIDLLRIETKVRYKDGEEHIGKGVGVSLVNLETPISKESDVEEGDLSNFVFDPNLSLPNEIERFDLEDFFELHSDIYGEIPERDKKILECLINEEDQNEIGEKFGLTESRICQIKRNLYSTLRVAYNKYSKARTITRKFKPNKYVDHLIEKKDKVSKYRSKIIRNRYRARKKLKKAKGFVKHDLRQPATIEVVLKLFDEYKHSLLTPRQLCEKYGIPYDSFRQKVFHLKLPFKKVKQEKKKAYILSLCREWDEIEGSISLPEFCRLKRIEHYNFRNWLKKRHAIESKWYCLRTNKRVKRNCEHIIAANISKYMNTEVFAPQVTILKQTVRGKRPYTEAMFPGYFFLKFNLKDFLKVSNFPGVVEVVRFNEKIPSIPDFVLDNLREEVQTRVVENKKVFEEGDLVEILEGSLKGYCTKVYKPDIGDNRVALLIEVLGKTTQIDIERNKIAKV